MQLGVGVVEISRGIKDRALHRYCRGAGPHRAGIAIELRLDEQAERGGIGAGQGLVRCAIRVRSESRD